VEGYLLLLAFLNNYMPLFLFSILAESAIMKAQKALFGRQASILYLSEVEKNPLQEFTTRIKPVLKNNIREIKLFGSKSTGRFHEDSDIDVLVLVYQRDEEVLDLISERLYFILLFLFAVLTVSVPACSLLFRRIRTR